MAPSLSLGLIEHGIISSVSDHRISFIAKEVMMHAQAYAIHRSYHGPTRQK